MEDLELQALATKIQVAIDEADRLQRWEVGASLNRALIQLTGNGRSLRSED